MTEAVRQRLRDRFALGRTMTKAIRGKTGGHTVHEVLGTKQRATHQGGTDRGAAASILTLCG